MTVAAGCGRDVRTKAGAADQLTLVTGNGRHEISIEIADTEDAIAQLGADLAPVRIHNRDAFSRAQQTGLTAQEFEPAGKAALEIKHLYDYTCIQLFTSATSKTGSHGQRPELATSGA